MHHLILKFYLYFFSEYAFQFPHKGTDDYIQIWGMPRLMQFTVCFWMQTKDTATVRTFFSYAVPREFNEIVLIYRNGFQLQINGGEGSRFVILLFSKKVVS